MLTERLADLVVTRLIARKCLPGRGKQTGCKKVYS
jgi:hypothetical protein